MIRRAVLALLGPLVLLAAVGCGEDSTPRNPWEFAQSCGDNAAADGEACDGTDLRGRDCQSFGYGGGELRCNEACTGFLVGQCTGAPAWNSDQHRSECYDCADDEVCIGGQCQTACSGEPVESEVLDIDVAIHEVSGQLTFGGEVLSADIPTPSLVFESRETGHRHTAAYSDGSYTARLYQGTYDVYLNDFRPQHKPWLGPRIASDVVVDGDQTLDFELPGPIRLAVSIEPARRLRDLEFSGTVVIRRLGEPDETTNEVRVDIDEGGRQDKVIWTLPGRFSARFYEAEREHSSERMGTQLLEPFTIAQRADLTIPIEMPLLEGRVRFPDRQPQAFENVYVTAKNKDVNVSGVTHRVDDEGRFSFPVLAGDYEVSARIGRFVYSGEYMATTEFHHDGAGRVELMLGEDFVSVRGTVEPAPELDEPSFVGFRARGELALHRDAKLVDGRFATSLPPGTYDLVVHSREQFEDGYMKIVTPGELEVGDQPVEGVVLERAPQPAEPPPTVSVRGEVTVEGETMPANTVNDEPRGQLYFECLTPRTCDGRTWRPLGVSGEATYEVDLAPGSYLVTLHAGEHYDPHDPPSNAVPAGRYVLEPRLEVSTEEVNSEWGLTRDFDLNVVHVTAEVTANGEAWPSGDQFSPATREETQWGWLSLNPISRNHPDARAEAADAGPTRLSIDVVPGTYGLSVSLGGLEGPGLWQPLEVGDDAEVSWDLPLNHAEIHLTYDGHPWWGEQSRVMARTQLSVFATTVDADGVAHVWWLGEDPTFMLLDRQRRDFGRVMLRRGCADLQP